MTARTGTGGGVNDGTFPFVSPIKCRNCGTIVPIWEHKYYGWHIYNTEGDCVKVHEEMSTEDQKLYDDSLALWEMAK